MVPVPRLGKPPEKVTQLPHDSGPQHLRRLARLRPGQRADAQDLWEYTQDLLYSGEIQSDLVAHVLPFCLEAWRDDLRGISGYGGFVEYLYPVLADRHIFDQHLNAHQTRTVSAFMRSSILEEIDSQVGLRYEGKGAATYRWVTAFTTYGVLLSDFNLLWDAWWPLETRGRAVAFVHYASCLMYPDNENPVFAPWTPNGGGGPPSLWEFGGHLYTNRWLEPNVLFLRKVLTAENVISALERVVKRLKGEPEEEIALIVASDVSRCGERLDARCCELPRLLSTVQNPGELLEWSS